MPMFRKHTEQEKKNMSKGMKKAWKNNPLRKKLLNISGLKKGWILAKLRKEAKNNKICPVCNKKFYRRGNRKSITKSCSKKCAGVLKRGKNHPRWIGGKSREPYPLAWRNTLKRAIRERDKYVCQICKNCGKHIHHIDYNKNNLNPKNLITLCANCHSKTNINRKEWRRYFEKRLR